MILSRMLLRAAGCLLVRLNPKAARVSLVPSRRRGTVQQQHRLTCLRAGRGKGGELGLEWEETRRLRLAGSKHNTQVVPEVCECNTWIALQHSSWNVRSLFVCVPRGKNTCAWCGDLRPKLQCVRVVRSLTTVNISEICSFSDCHLRRSVKRSARRLKWVV